VPAITHQKYQKEGQLKNRFDEDSKKLKREKRQQSQENRVGKHAIRRWELHAIRSKDGKKQKREEERE